MNDHVQDKGFALESMKMLFNNMLHEVHIWRLIFDKNEEIIGWKLVDANNLSLNSWGVKLEDVVGKTAEELFPNSKPTELFLPIVKKIYKEQKPYTWERYFPETNQLLQMKSIPVGDCFISTGIDVSEKKQMENYVMQAQKMETIGTLTSGIAHDINNILTIVYGNISKAQRTNSPEELKLYLDQLSCATTEIKGLTHSILKLVRDYPKAEDDIPVQSCVEEMSSFLKSILPNGIVINTHIEENLPPLHGERININQIIMNLFTNALTAMKDKKEGKLDVSLCSTKLNNKEIKTPESIILNGDYMVFKVSDNGTGIKSEDINKIFQLGFSTKLNEEGTGLGLPITLKHIKKLGGAIEVETEVGRGTDFTVYFPLLL